MFIDDFRLGLRLHVIHDNDNRPYTTAAVSAFIFSA